MTFVSRFLVTAFVLGGGVVTVVGDAHAVGELPTAIPEPTTLGLLACGAVAGLVVARFRKRK